MSVVDSQSLSAWEEKYRPRTFEEFIDNNDRTKKIEGKVTKIKRILKAGIFKHFMFHGVAGTGKTTLAHIVAKEWLSRVLPAEEKELFHKSVVMLNASDDRGIDIIRNKIKSIITSTGAYAIILDEADAMTDDAQTALRRLMEQAKKSNNPKLFILTCNYPEKIIEPLHSRCEVIEFKPIPKAKMIKKLQDIVTSEGVQTFRFSDDVVTNEERGQAIQNFFEYVYDATRGDMRKAISFCQEFVYIDTTGTKIMDLNLQDKVEAKFKTDIATIMEQIFDAAHPSFENIINYVENIKKNNVFVNKVFRDIFFWLAKHSRNPKKNDPPGTIKLGQIAAYHMGIAVAKYEARIRNKSDYLVQMSAMFQELSLIYLTNHIVDVE